MSVGTHVLVIDDYESARQTLSMILAGEGYLVETAASGQEGLAKVTERDFDVVLLDIRLPDMEGVDLVRPIKRVRPDTAVVMVTAYATTETAVRALNEGASGYVHKPLVVEELFAVLREVIQRRHLAEMNRQLTEQMRQELRERVRLQERYRELVENLNDAIFTVRLDGVVTYVSPVIEGILGYSPDELTGVVFTQLLCSEDVDRVWREFGEALEGKTHASEFRMVRKDQRVRWVRASARPVLESGQVAGIQGVVTDITDRKRTEEALQEERDKAQMYLDLAGVIFVALDTDGVVTLINRKGCEILGYRQEEIVGKNWFEHFVPERLRPTVLEVLKELLAGGATDVEYYENPVLSRAKGERLVAWHNTVLKDEKGNIIGTLSSGDDITERKQVEEQILAQRRQLRALAAELTLAEEKERRRIAGIVHDRIGQGLFITKLKLGQAGNTRSQRDTQRILSELEQLVGALVNDARQLSYELGSPILYELGFEAAVQSHVERARERYGIRFEFKAEEGPKPMSENVQLTLLRAVQELLFNVVKHARATQATVSVSRDDGHVTVDVADDGIGFGGDWEPGRSQTEGLGLFSIRERLSHLGGSMSIESKPGQGARVVLRAPLAPAAELSSEGERDGRTNCAGR